MLKKLEIVYQQRVQMLALGIPTLFCRRQEINNSLFKEIVQDKSLKLHSLLPVRNTSTGSRRTSGFRLSRQTDTRIPFKIHHK